MAEIKLLQRFKERFAKEKVSTALDIGTSVIKLVGLKFFNGTVELEHFALEPVQDNLAAALKNIMQGRSISRVNISFSGPATVLRYITLPKMNSAELKQSLKFEAQKHIPFPISDVYLDGSILKDDIPDGKMLVLLAALKKDVLNQRLSVLKGAGVRVSVADIDSLALINAFTFNCAEETTSQEKAVALVNIGGLETNLNILEQGVPRLSREINIAGHHFIEKIRESCGKDLAGAEKMLMHPQPEDLKRIATCIESVLAKLAMEVRVSFDYYESQSSFSVGKIFLSGGGSLINGLKESLESLLGTDVGYWDPLKRLTVSPAVDKSALDTLTRQLAVPIGLALRL